MNRRDKDILMGAVEKSTLRDVENALNEHNVVFDESYFDYKLLRAALERKHLGIINFLLNKIGCRAGNPNKVKAEKTPLHLAMELNNNENIIRKILSQGALIFDKDENGEIALLTGFKGENFHAVRTLLTYSKPNCSPDDKDAILQFHIACVTNHVPAATHYLMCGINPNNSINLDSEEYSGLNPVQFAAEKDYYELFEELVFHGGDLSIKNAKGLTPLHIIYYTSPAKERESRIIETFKYGNETKFINAKDSNRVSHLHLSCMLNKPNLVQIFIDNGANVNSAISSRCTINPRFTPLHFAVKNGCEKVVELLLENGADCNKKDTEGKTPLHLANKVSEDCKIQIIKMLLNYNPAIKDNLGYTPLHMEFYYGNRENRNIFDMLFSKISKKINCTNNEGLSHFHIACATNNINEVKNFLDFGVQVDSCVTSGIYNGYTALHFAALHNQKDIVELLLEKNADVNIKTKEFQITPLHLACELNYAKFREENLNQKLENFKSFPINLGSSSNWANQLAIINLLLSHGALVDAKDSEGNIPLLHACTIQKNYYKLKWSYDSHDYLSRLEREGLIKEIRTRLEEIIEILLCHKTDVVAYSNKQNETILHIICKYNSLKVHVNKIKLILTKGTDIDAVDNDGLTALHIALKFGNNRMAQMLLKLKANVNIKCKFNDSKIPLHIVFNNVFKERDMFCALLESGSDVNIPIGEQNKTLLHEAISDHGKFTIKKLLQYGADINLEDSLGNSCMSSLSKWNNDEYSDDDDFKHYHDHQCAKIFQHLYIHVQKLLALGLHVNKKIWKCCKQFYPRHTVLLQESRCGSLKNLDNIFHDCTKELERLKLKKIDNYTSLYSILLKDHHELSKHVRNKTLIDIIKAPDLTETFPLYSYLLKLQFKRGLVRSDLYKSAKESLSNIIGVNLPDLCLDLIIKYSTNEDIANLKAAALLKKSLKRKFKDSCSNKINSSSELQKEDENPRKKRLNLRNKVSKISKKA